MSVKNKIHDYYDELKVGDEHFGKKKECKLCRIKVDKSSTTNLVRHLRAKHPKEFSEWEGVRTNNAEKQCKRPSSSKNGPELKQTKLTFKSDSLLQDCAELVTVHGRPLSIFKDKAMLNILSKADVNNKIYPEKVRDFIQKQAGVKREQLVEFLAKKLLSLELDFAENMGRSFLGIIARLYSNDSPQTIVLDCKEVYERHDRFFIASEINKCMKKFKLKPEQILSFVTDTASNMKAGVRVASTELEMEAKEKELENSGALLGLRLDESMDAPIDFNADVSEIEIEDENDFDGDSEGFTESFDYVFQTDCAAHVLQLAVTDFLKAKALRSVLSHSQLMAVKLKNPAIASLLKRQNLKRPILMHKVRWNWTYLNLDRIMELKTFCMENESIRSLKVSDTVWLKLEALRNTLKPVYELTLALQTANLTVPEMISKWFSKKLALRLLQNEYSSKLHRSIENREIQIFSKPIIIASMFFDKRFSQLLSNDEVETAKGVINQIQSRIKSLSESTGNLIPTIPPAGTGVRETAMNEEDYMLEQMLGQTVVEQEEEYVGGHSADALVIELGKFQALKRLRADTNILDFWKKQNSVFPLLSPIALAILSIPVTEVDVERLFSHLTFVHSKLRNCLSNEIISDILFLRMNSKEDFDNNVEEILY